MIRFRPLVLAINDRLNAVFTAFADRVAAVLGSPRGFVVAICIVLVWACFGPTAHFSDTWQLIINTGTTIVTFLVVFLVTNNQNRIADLAQRQADRIEQVERHLETLAAADHVEHGRLLREIYSHITCQGHTTLGEVTAPSVPLIGSKLMPKTSTRSTRQNRPTARHSGTLAH